MQVFDPNQSGSLSREQILIVVIDLVVKSVDDERAHIGPDTPLFFQPGKVRFFCHIGTGSAVRKYLWVEYSGRRPGSRYIQVTSGHCRLRLRTPSCGVPGRIFGAVYGFLGVILGNTIAELNDGSTNYCQPSKY